jgi:hypothetical protein
MTFGFRRIDFLAISWFCVQNSQYWIALACLRCAVAYRRDGPQHSCRRSCDPVVRSNNKPLPKNPPNGGAAMIEMPRPFLRKL